MFQVILVSARFFSILLCANILLSASLVQCFLFSQVNNAVVVLFFTLFPFISVALNSRLWLETAPLTDSSLRDKVPGLTGWQLDSNVPSTVLKIRVWLIVVA